MKKTILIVFILSILGCKEEKNTSPENSKIQIEIQKKLKKTDLPYEVIETSIAFLTNPIRVDNSLQLKYELNILNNFKIPFTLHKVEIYDLEKEDKPLAVFNTDYIDENFDRPGNKNLKDLKQLDLKGDVNRTYQSETANNVTEMKPMHLKDAV